MRAGAARHGNTRRSTTAGITGKWLKSLELHAKYSSLDDDSYWKVQPWVEHQRPSRWIIDLAMQKTVALRTHVEERVKAGDAKYSDSLELMIFLANLVGSEHIERFIPVADAQNERPLAPKPPIAARQHDSASGGDRHGHAGNAEIPRPPNAHRRRPARPRWHAPNASAAAAVKPAPKAAGQTRQAEEAGRQAGARQRPSRGRLARQVIADAARLVQWGRKWYELPELIARMADRPSLPDVRRILKENKVGHR